MKKVYWLHRVVFPPVPTAARKAPTHNQIVAAVRAIVPCGGIQIGLCSMAADAGEREALFGR